LFKKEEKFQWNEEIKKKNKAGNKAREESG
jgi:hypothetical protein